MRILVINGSPKRERSDTMHLTRAFLAGMNDIQPQTVRTIHAIDRHIEYCTVYFSACTTADAAYMRTTCRKS